VNIRPATFEDIRFIAELEKSCPTAAHWSEQSYRDSIAGSGFPERVILVAEACREPSSPVRGSDATRISAFLVARHVASEWELENIVVAPTVRRVGLGRQLLHVLLQRARETNSSSVFLEVRESNAAARKLYEKLGFDRIGRRSSYYSAPFEDAVLYRLELP